MSRYFNWPTSLTRFVRFDTARSEDVNNALDTLTTGLDALDLDVNRAIKLPSGTADQTLALGAGARANKVLAFDGSGNITVSVNDVDSAATSAAASAASAVTASTYADAAQTSANSAAATYDAFDDRYLGSKAADPTLDNDGNALLVGALYWNSVSNEMRVWSGSAWVTAYLSSASFATLSTSQTLTNKTIAYASNTLTGVQPTLVSGTSIKTVNSGSLLGSGDLVVGDVFGPASSTANSIATFNGTTGKTIQDGGKTLPSGTVVGTTDAQTLTNKTIDIASNTLTGVQATLVSGTNIKSINSNSLLGSGNLAITAAVGYASRSTNTIFGVGDAGYLIDFTGAGFTQTFTAAATLGAGWYIYLRNTGTGNVTLDPNASETIDGTTTGVLIPGMTIMVTCTGTAFNVVRIGPNVFTDVKTSGTSWTCPLGVRNIKVTVVGGGGGVYTAVSSAGGGGGTAIKNFVVSPGTAYTYAVGSLGTNTVSPTAPGAGGNSTFTVGATTITGGGGAGGATGTGGTATNGDLNLPGRYATTGGGASPGDSFLGNGAFTVAGNGYGAGSFYNASVLSGTAGVVIIEY